MNTGVAVDPLTTYMAENFLLTRKAHKATKDPSAGPLSVCTLAGHCAKLAVTSFVYGNLIQGNAAAGGRKQVEAGAVVTLKLDGGATGALGTVHLTGKDARLSSSKCRRTIDRDLADMVLNKSGITGTYAQPLEETYVDGKGNQRSRGSGDPYTSYPMFESTYQVFAHAKLTMNVHTSYGTWPARRRRGAGAQSEEDPAALGREQRARVPRQDGAGGGSADVGSQQNAQAPASDVCAPEAYPPQLKTWLSQTVKLDANGKAEVKVTMPDESNIHDITGVLLTRGSGVAESDPVVLESTKPFAINCDMPYTVAKGEIFQVRRDQRNCPACGLVPLTTWAKVGTLAVSFVCLA